MTLYKHTLNLPQTDFPMKANLAVSEANRLARWQEQNLYAEIRASRAACPKFILHLGPPYANGHIHLGTALNTILKDVIAKAKTLSGFDAPLVPGWDCHGLPIELNVEKKVGKPGRQLTPKAFRQACRDYADGFVDIQRTEFKRLGIIADWDHPYLTMDYRYEANTVRSLAKIIANGHLKRGQKPVHWCLDCASALAEAEVEYAEKTSPSIDVRFSCIEPQTFLRQFSLNNLEIAAISLPVWTTTPWTLPANEAVALNPELFYVLAADDQGEHWIIAEALYLSVLARYGRTAQYVIAHCKGAALAGLQLQHPFYKKTVPVIIGDHVLADSGTGAVHTAPAHGLDDYQMGIQYHLPLQSPINDQGCYAAHTEFFAGLHVNKAANAILDLLAERNNLLHHTKITHSYPHCWRHKTPLMFRATPQWFISMEQQELRSQSLAAIKKVTWLPESGETRIHSMISHRPDWCISRQRTWGVPLALFVHKDTGELHPDTLILMEQIAKSIEQQGIDAWYELDAQQLLGETAAQYRPVPDVLDVWFDSGVSHQCVLQEHAGLHQPSDMVLEGSDQHRGWFQTSLLTSLAMTGHAPFKSVLTHGYVVDGEGRKMSKSLGNVIAPQEIIQTLGADVLRLWAALIDYRYDVNASKEILARFSETYRRIRNTARFLLANLHDFDPEQHGLPCEQLLSFDQWLIEQTIQLQQDIIAAYDAYQFHIVMQKVHHFCLETLGGFYLDIIKDRQYTMQANSRGRRSAQTALWHVLQAFVLWIAPVLSFTADEIWQFVPGVKKSLWTSEWYVLPSLQLTQSVDWPTIQLVRQVVNKELETARARGTIGSALDAKVVIYCSKEYEEVLQVLGEELKFVFITSEALVRTIEEKSVAAKITELPGVMVEIIASPFAKCERCWHKQENIGVNQDHLVLCERCIDNVSGKGETRKFV